MLFPRHLTVAALLVALASTTACGGGDNEPETSPPSSTPTTQSPSSSESTPTEPIATAPAWEDEYTDAQLEAFEAALARYESYETRTEPIWAEGKVTDRAEALFKQYYPSPLWEGRLQVLSSYEDGNVRVEGTPGVYWSRGKSISDSGKSVVINQCVDYTQGRTTQNGEEVDAPGWISKPNLRTITLNKPDGYDWLIYGVVDATSGKARPCTP